MASRSETANGANQDVERAYELGRRAVRSGTCMRYGAGPDGVRAYGSGRRACYGSGRRVTRCGPGRRANCWDGVRYAVRMQSARANGAGRNHVLSVEMELHYSYAQWRSFVR